MEKKSGRKKSMKHRKNSSNRLAIIGVTIVVVFLAIAVSIRGSSLKQQDRDYSQKEESLEAAIAAEEKRSEELTEKKSYVNTKQYVEQQAREKFGMVYPDEIKIKPKE